jgi:hypothetical protein
VSQVPATQADMQFATTGLEDFQTSDAVLPRIKIVQTEGVWQDNLTSTKFEVLRFIVLGLVKQRVLFHHNVEDNDVPMCKSSDFRVGYPNPDAPQKKSFPWELSGFKPEDFPPDAEGNIKLPCDGCQLKEWGSSPISEAPYCAEQFTLPIYYDMDPALGGEFAPAILTLQKSSIKPIRTYLTSFAQANKPPFLAVGRATLRTQQRGQVIYSIPTFTREGESDRNKWMEYSEQFADMKSFLQRPPVREADDAVPVAPQNNDWQGHQQQPDPWAGQPQPVQQQPVQPQPVQQQAPVAPPVQQAPVQQAPVAPPVQQAPVPPPPPPVPVQQQQPVQQQPPVEQPPVESQPVQPVQPETPQQPAQQPEAQPPASPPAAGQGLPF